MRLAIGAIIGELNVRAMIRDMKRSWARSTLRPPWGASASLGYLRRPRETAREISPRRKFLLGMRESLQYERCRRRISRRFFHLQISLSAVALEGATKENKSSPNGFPSDRFSSRPRFRRVPDLASPSLITGLRPTLIGNAPFLPALIFLGA